MPKKTAVIVINHNGRDHLQGCFQSLAEQGYTDFQAYLLDNASTDGSRDYTASAFPGVKIIALDKNYGFAGAYNIAADKIDAEYLVFLNNDTRVAAGWLDKLVAAVEKSPDTAIAGSKILFWDAPMAINSAGQKITPAGLSFDIGFGAKDQEEFNTPKTTGSICGASLLIKKSVFRELRGFDGNYFIFCEDTDLCWRAWLAGYKTVYAPQSIVYHKFGSLMGKRDSPARIFYIQRNSILTVIKNFGAARMARSLALILCYTAIKLVLFALQYKPANIKALFKGTFAIFPLLPSTFARRRSIQKNRKIPDRLLETENLMAGFTESFAEYLRVSRLYTGGK
ncbi:MAG: glycosyltransferase family 2 protein [Candidatus Omnitrophica bacterium]|nr:glycosyltransferase family 2 protein [Candidatus Omnitrophota bacterium]